MSLITEEIAHLFFVLVFLYFFCIFLFFVFFFVFFVFCIFLYFFLTTTLYLNTVPSVDDVDKILSIGPLGFAHVWISLGFCLSLLILARLPPDSSCLSW
jgi:hypothetical protein